MGKASEQKTVLSADSVYRWMLFITFAVALSFSLNALINFSATQATSARVSQIQNYNAAYNGALLMTTAGRIDIEFYSNRAPLTVNNFIQLSRKNLYDGTRFHRIIPGVLIQGGDPLSKDMDNKDKWGTGGPGHSITKENTRISPRAGSIAMVDKVDESISHGSQFFILTSDDVASVDENKYTIFAQVTDGMNIVRSIAQASTTDENIPVTPVTIEEVILQ